MPASRVRECGIQSRIRFAILLSALARPLRSLRGVRRHHPPAVLRHPHEAALIGEMQYEDTYRLAYIRGPEGIIVALAEQLG